MDPLVDLTPVPETVPASSSSSSVPAGPSIPGYDELTELGRGAMGVVYRARDLKLGRIVALKMILGGPHASPDQMQRFQNEARAIATLQHANIVQVYEVGQHNGMPFFTLDLIEGGTLADRLRGQPQPPRQAAQLIETLARGVQAAHGRGIVHRDLKPGNILMTADGTPKIADFGLARQESGDGVPLTVSGAIVGTPEYMAPEQASGKGKLVGPASDIYSLGVILYEMLTGRTPFRNPDIMETLLQVIADEPVTVRSLQPKVPIDLETICHKCLQKDSSKRYASAHDLADDLGRYLRGESIVARPVGSLERGYRWVKRNPIVSALLTAVILVLSVGVAVSTWFANSANKESIAARKAEEDAKEQKTVAEKQKTRADDETKIARKAEQAALEAKQRADNEAKAARKVENEASEQKARAEDQLSRAEWLVYAGKLLLAQAAYNEDNMIDAWHHLEDCQWNLRGWEHAHLRWRYDASEQTLRGHTREVSSVSWSPDGKRILTGSNDETAKVWDAEKGQEVLTLKGHTSWVTSVSWSPDGQRILTGSGDKTAKVWDAEKGQEVLTLKGHTDPVYSVSWSPDGKKTFAWDIAGKVLAWDATTGQPVAAENPPPRPAPGPANSPDGRFAAKPDGIQVQLVDLRRPPPETSPWPLPDATERQRYHSEQATLAEKEKQWFAVAFHVGRLLLDDRDNVELKRRREQALQQHVVPGEKVTPTRMEKVP